MGNKKKKEAGTADLLSQGQLKTSMGATLEGKTESDGFATGSSAVTTPDSIPQQNISARRNQRCGLASSQSSAGEKLPTVGNFTAAAHPVELSNPYTRSYHVVPPSPEGPVWNRRDGIYWKVGSHPRDIYAPSRSPKFTRVRQSHSINAGSSNGQAEAYPDLLERLSIASSLSNPNVHPFPHPGTVIEYSLEYMQVLRCFVHSADILRGNGYTLRELSESELNGKKRCKGCGKSMRSLERKWPSKMKEKVDEIVERLDDECSPGPTGGRQNTALETSPPIAAAQFSSAEKPVQVVLATATPTQPREPKIRCKYHDGVVKFKTWSCCGNQVSSDPCTGIEFHIPRQYPTGEIERLWKFHATPAATAYSDIRQAVAIDCEMGTAESGDNELIRVTLIDYFSSAVLVDSLVYPDVTMSHYNTCFSGVTKKDMEMARARGRCFRGRDQARTAVWRFVGPNTIVVGHSPHNDLNAMRWIHSVVVDTWLIESTNAKIAKAKAERELKEAQPPNAEQELEEAQPPNVSIDTSATPNKSQQISRKGPKGSGALSLKTLAMVRLKREIQAAGKKGHDSLEDALAARDLAHWNVGNNNSAAAGR